MNKIISERDAKKENDDQNLASLTDEIEIKTKLIEDTFMQTKRDSVQLQEEIIIRGERTREQLIKDTRKRANKMQKDKMAELEIEIKNAERIINKEIDALSDQLREIFL